MRPNPLLISLKQTAKRERKLGHHKRANGIGLIACGVMLLPVPVIGVPLLLCGLVKAFTSGNQ